MTILSYPTATGAMGPEAYCRTSYILAGEDRITSGLQMSWFSNRTVQITAGSGVVGGIAFTSTQTELRTSDLESSSNPRFDRLVARKKWPSLEVELVILKGAPAPSPVLPALTREFGERWEFGLGYWLVPANNGNAIPNGLAWGHYANMQIDQYILDVTVGNGSDAASTLIYAVPNDFRIPGAGKLAIDALVTLDVGGSVQAGSVTIQAAGQSKSVTWSHRLQSVPTTRVPLTVPITLEANINPGGGIVAVIFEVGTVANSSPVGVQHLSADIFEDMGLR